MLILPFDTETTGKPIWKDRSGDKDQPHMVQLATILCDGKTGEVVETYEAIVKPDGWIIPQETIDIHGITNEQAMDEGVSELEALEGFLALYDRCGLRVAHNTTFDNRIIRIALKRYLPDLIPDEVWKDRDLYFCTLMKAKKIMGGKKGHTLEEAYNYFTGNELEGAHSAMPDARACMEIYFAMKKLEEITEEAPVF